MDVHTGTLLDTKEGESPKGFFNPVIPTQNFRANPVTRMVIFNIPPSVQTCNPKSRPHFALRSRIPDPEKPIEDPQENAVD